MSKTLYEHQRTALQYALRVGNPALFLEMRLGKTLVAIRRAKLVRPRQPDGLRALVAAPSSALGSWQRDLDDEGQRVVWLTGTRKKRLAALNADEPGWHLINKEGWLALREIGDVPWDVVVVDESTFIKNPRAKVTKFFMDKFRDAQVRMILTGTPAPEGEDDYYCQFKFLNGRAFGCKDYWSFRSKHMQPNFVGGWDMKWASSDWVRRQVGLMACVIKRKDVGYDEQRVYEERVFEMPKPVRKSYDLIEEKFKLTWDGKEDMKTKWTGAQWQWCRQLCGGFVEDDMVWSAKLDELLSLLKSELADEQVVVWCSYNNEVAAVEAALRKKKVPCASMTGDTKLSDRLAIRDAFQKGTHRVLVLQQAIAQTGMDLSASDTAVYYSTPVGGFARQQTEDRILSLKKVERGTPMLFIDFVVEGTVDRDVMTLLDDKSARSTVSLGRALETAMKERLKWTRNLKG